MDEWFVKLPAPKADIPHFGGKTRQRVARHLPTWPKASEPQFSLAPPMPMVGGPMAGGPATSGPMAGGSAPNAPTEALVDPITALSVHPGAAGAGATIGTGAAIGTSALGTSALGSTTIGNATIGNTAIGDAMTGTEDDPLPTTADLIRLSRLRNGWLSREELRKLRKSLS